MKDAKGHGSDKRGAGGYRGTVVSDMTRSEFIAKHGTTAEKAAQSGFGKGGASDFARLSDAQAAATLAQGGGAKSAPVDTHPAMSGASPFNREALNKTYLRNEDRNAHAENVVLLTKTFGTPEEHAKAKEIVAARNKVGYLPDSTASVPKVRDFSYAMDKKYYPKLTGR